MDGIGIATQPVLVENESLCGLTSHPTATRLRAYFAHKRSQRLGILEVRHMARPTQVMQ